MSNTYVPQNTIKWLKSQKADFFLDVSMLSLPIYSFHDASRKRDPFNFPNVMCETSSLQNVFEAVVIR